MIRPSASTDLPTLKGTNVNHTNNCVYAHTGSGDYPPFININRNRDGVYIVGVRSAGNGGRDFASMSLTPEQLEHLATGAMAALHGGEPVNTIVTDDMVARFLGWPLPPDFNPDGYISIDKDRASAGTWPIGTNLLNAIQARAMLEHVLGSTTRPVETKTYPDGTMATGTVPLPDASPTSEPVQAKALTFGDALHYLKLGRKVARAGWNGKGMWLSLSGPLEGRKIHADSFWSENNTDYANEQPGSLATVLPCITMKTATGDILMGWLASQTDMLAEDWVVVA